MRFDQHNNCFFIGGLVIKPYLVRVMRNEKQQWDASNVHVLHGARTQSCGLWAERVGRTCVLNLLLVESKMRNRFRGPRIVCFGMCGGRESWDLCTAGRGCRPGIRRPWTVAAASGTGYAV